MIHSGLTTFEDIEKANHNRILKSYGKRPQVAALIVSLFEESIVLRFKKNLSLSAGVTYFFLFDDLIESAAIAISILLDRQGTKIDLLLIAIRLLTAMQHLDRAAGLHADRQPRNLSRKTATALCEIGKILQSNYHA